MSKYNRTYLEWADVVSNEEEWGERWVAPGYDCQRLVICWLHGTNQTLVVTNMLKSSRYSTHMTILTSQWTQFKLIFTHGGPHWKVLMGWKNAVKKPCILLISEAILDGSISVLNCSKFEELLFNGGFAIKYDTSFMQLLLYLLVTFRLP